MASIAEGVAPSPVDPAPAGAEAFPPPAQGWYPGGVLAVITPCALLDQNLRGLLIQRRSVASWIVSSC